MGSKLSFNARESSAKLDFYQTAGYSKLGVGSSQSFGKKAPIPKVKIPTRVETFPFGLRISDVKAPSVNSSKFPRAWDGSVSKTTSGLNGEPAKVVSTAYGYLHTEKKTSNADMTDLSVQPIQYTKKVPNLAPAKYNYDVFSQTGQGTGGTFRAHRPDVSVLSEAENKTDERTTTTNIEAGADKSFSNIHVNFGYKNETASSISGPWNTGGSSITTHAFPAGATNGDARYENYYFKAMGELTGPQENDHHLPSWGQEQALRIGLEKKGGLTNKYWSTHNNLQFRNNATTSLSGVTAEMKHQSTRTPRAKVIQTLNQLEAAEYGMSQNVEFDDNGSTVSKFSGTRPDHHISEIQVTEPDGMNYVYGLPVYNNKQVSTTMSVPEESNFNTPKVAISSTTYQNTFNQYLERTEMGEFVHSWLLTAVVGPDYKDLTGDGPSEDDMGYWAKFNYKKMDASFGWRTPYTEANYQPGSPSDSRDDVAHFTYGTREQYYLVSIETKSHIAVFHTSPRADGHEAAGEFALTRGVNTSYKLDRVQLFTQKEYAKSQPIPIKTAYFQYDYSLCKGVQNNHKGPQADPITGQEINLGLEGKLTLKRLFFTYRNNDRGKFSPYTFGYGNPDSPVDNPRYEPLNMDRWGNYQANRVTAGPNGDLGIYGAVSYRSKQFPYTLQKHITPLMTFQDAADYDPAAGHWSLKSIDLPSGSTISMDYEKDDYAFVEDKRAMQMLDIVGFGDDVSNESIDHNHNYLPHRMQPNNDPYNLKRHAKDGNYKLDGGKNFRIYFELETPISSGSTAQGRFEHIRDRYIRDSKKFYFKSLIDLKNNLDDTDIDYVTGYFELPELKDHAPIHGRDYLGAVKRQGDPSGDYTIGYLTVKGVKLNETNWTGIYIHPFQAAALKHLRTNRSELIHNIVVPDTSPRSQLTNLLGSVLKNTEEIFSNLVSFNAHNYGKNYCRHAFLNGESVIRLHDADGRKVGGGDRVRKISMTNNWAQDPISYGQTYDYTTVEDGQIISTGVAYEPSIGGEESALRQPIPYKESSFLKADQTLYLTDPILESYYPGGSVTYSQVKVESIAPEQHSNNPTAVSAAPITIHQFYTGRDFPIVCNQTDINSDAPIRIPVHVPGIYSTNKNRLARSQGYSIVLNDMNGKPKMTETRTRADNLAQLKSSQVISRQEFVYFTKEDYVPKQPNYLTNRVPILTSASQADYGVLGEDYDVFIHLHENRRISNGEGLDGNVSITLSSPVPIVIPAPIPNMSETESSMKTAVTMKVIHRTGILKEVITTTNESVIVQSNEAFDPITGQAILTQVTNEFHDKVFSYTYPAHWYYDGLANASQNIGLTLPNLIHSSGGLYSLPSPLVANGLFTPGDLVMTEGGGIRILAHVVENAANTIRLIDMNGAPITEPNLEVKVIRSGHKNQLGLAAGELTAKSVSGVGTGSAGAYVINDILNASAIEYTDAWATLCGECGFDLSQQINPYQNGTKGHWRPYRSHAYLTNRNYNNSVQYDGVYTDFVPFPWLNPSSASTKWQAASTITLYSPYGFELENKDALGNYTSALYSYDESLPTAVGQNSRHREMAFDSFEDYDCDDCEDTHFDFKPNSSNVSTQEAHTGRKSIKVAPGQSIETARIIRTGCTNN